MADEPKQSLPRTGSGEVARFAPTRIPYHPAIQERFGVDQAGWRALVDAVWPGARTAEAVVLALSYCKARKLDPFKRPVHIVGVWSREQKRVVESCWPGIGELRTTAFRTGLYAGREATEWGPDRELSFDSATISYPEWAQVTVHRLDRHGNPRPYPGPRVYWLESYATAGRDTMAPNEMWRRRTRGQLDKCFDPETEVLTDRGFQRFSEVTGRVLQVSESGALSPTDATPFCRDYSGEMIALHNRDLDFVVTPNHDLLTTVGKIEAGALFEMAMSKAKFWVSRCLPATAGCDIAIRDIDLRLAAAFLADGFDGHGEKLAFKVSRPGKRQLLMSLDPISVTALENAGAVAIAANGRQIVTRNAQTLYQFDAGRIAQICSSKKEIRFAMVARLSNRQARIFVDTWLACDGSRNKKTGVRRVYTSRPDHASAFELAAVTAGMAVSDRKYRRSDISTTANIVVTVSERSEIGLIRWGRPHNRSKNNISGRTGLVLEQNSSGKVWCVSVPSGVIVVRRHGFSMLCGNCAEAAALRAAFPEELGNDYSAEEMEGQVVDHAPTRDQTTEPVPPTLRGNEALRSKLAPETPAVAEEPEDEPPETPVAEEPRTRPPSRPRGSRSKPAEEPTEAEIERPDEVAALDEQAGYDISVFVPFDPATSIQEWFGRARARLREMEAAGLTADRFVAYRKANYGGLSRLKNELLSYFAELDALINAGEQRR